MIGRIRSYIARYGWSIGSSGWGMRRRAERRVRFDPRARYHATPDEEWSFEQGAICLNGRLVEALIDPECPDIAQWCGLLDGLQAYRDWAYAIHFPKFLQLAFSVHGVQSYLLRQLRAVYDARLGGVTLQFGDGTLLLNNVNVRAVLALYAVRPTEKARRFLHGLKAKLALLLARHDTSEQVSRLAGVVQELYDDVCSSLARETIDSCRLPAGAGSVGQSVG